MLTLLVLLRHAEAAATIASPCFPAPGPCLLEPKTWGARAGSSDWGFSGVSGASAGAGAALLLSMAPSQLARVPYASMAPASAPDLQMCLQRRVCA